jgi:aminoglycoside 6'-N-acetyltransferase
MVPSVYAFNPMSAADLPLVRRWLETPHVARWWPDAERQISNIRRHLEETNIELFLVHADRRPLGYLQCYDVPAGGQPFPDQPPGSRGIDQFIGEQDLVGCGHGSAFIRLFVDRLFETGIPRVMTDPDPANRRAVRAYEKAGFNADRLVDTPHGRTLLMVRNP